MSPVIIDASAAASWLLPDEEAPAAFEAMARATLAAPWLLWAELRNVLIVNERRGRLPVGAPESFLAAFEGLAVRLDTAPVEAEVLRVARAHQLTVYDALYLELALRLGGRLATLDARLADAARRAAVDVLS